MMLAYCQQLETFVCYAPLESTGGNQFMLCRSLNNVIFVNGVRGIDNYAFDSAGPLGNLYFGEHLIRIGQQAFNFCRPQFLRRRCGACGIRRVCRMQEPDQPALHRAR